MKLWHFTGPEHLAGIYARGLQPAPLALPVLGGGLAHGAPLCWLSDSPEWIEQEWGMRPLVINGHTCDRTAVRLEFSIPKAQRREFIRWLPLAKRMARELPPHLDREQWAGAFIEYPGAEHWIVTRKPVWPGLVRALVERPPEIATQPPRVYAAPGERIEEGQAQ